jgi:hypothetical protein
MPRGGVEVQLCSFFNLGTRYGWVFNATLRPFYPRERDPVPIVYEDKWVPGPVWTSVENLAPPGFDPRTIQPVANRYTD